MWPPYPRPFLGRLCFSTPAETAPEPCPSGRRGCTGLVTARNLPGQRDAHPLQLNQLLRSRPHALRAFPLGSVSASANPFLLEAELLHTTGARWHRPTHCVSIRGGQDASASRPNRRTDQGYFSIVLRLVASQNILLSDAAGPRVLHGANLVEVNFRRAARGHALLPRHITHSGAGPRLPLTGFRVCTYKP
jgi:hypothetical protein